MVSVHPRMVNYCNVIISSLWLMSHAGREKSKLFQHAFHIGFALFWVFVVAVHFLFLFFFKCQVVMNSSVGSRATCYCLFCVCPDSSPYFTFYFHLCNILFNFFLMPFTFVTVLQLEDQFCIGISSFEMQRALERCFAPVVAFPLVGKTWKSHSGKAFFLRDLGPCASLHF